MIYTAVDYVSFYVYNSHLFLILGDTSFGCFNVGRGCFVLEDKKINKTLKAEFAMCFNTV